MAPATNVVSQPFPWLILNNLRKTCLALQCIRVALFRTALFHKGMSIFENC